jgi:hypothetical protein
VLLCALFQARAGTGVEPPTFRKLAGHFPYIKESRVLDAVGTHRDVVWINDFNQPATDAPFLKIYNIPKSLSNSLRPTCDNTVQLLPLCGTCVSCRLRTCPNHLTPVSLKRSKIRDM